MALVIDGYNLLHASGILGRGIGPGGLERSRVALLNFLVESLEARELAAATVVFDAREAPPGLPRSITHRGIRVRFADQGGDADEMIERLIQADTAPRRLVVVSSDHRLHRAARRRKARAIDSDVWYAEVLRKRIGRERHATGTAKPAGPPSEVEVQYWLRRFGLQEPSDGPSVKPPLASPFPPGYAEDVEEPDD
ncbi:MAG: NYN domain-containing protein [Pirellulales bacterium]